MYMYVCAQTIHAYTCTCIDYVLGIPKSMYVDCTYMYMYRVLVLNE